MGYQLIIDEGFNVGNSKGDDDRGRLHVKISNKNNESIPVTAVLKSSKPKTFRVNASLVGDYEIDLPDNTVFYLIRNTSGKSIRFADTQSNLSTNYNEIPKGAFLKVENILTSESVWVRTLSDNEVIEVFCYYVDS